MKLHNSTIERLIYLCNNHGGYSDEKRLVEAFSSMTLSPYMRKNNTTGEAVVLVETKLLVEEAQRNGANLGNVPAGQLHGSVVRKLMELYLSHSGHSFQERLRTAYSLLDLSSYDSKFSNKTVWVLTSDMMKAMRHQPIG